MRVAILLTGIDEVFSKIKNRLLDFFHCEGIEFDFFGHTWEETVAELNPKNDDWADISSKFVKKNIPFPHNDVRIKNYKTSSYQEIYDNYISMDGISDIVRQNRMIFFMSLMAQSLSTYHAFQALEEYKNKNNLEYDLIIKWRWDLLFDPNKQYMLNGLKEYKKNNIYTTHIDSLQMSDVWWGSDYETFKVIINDLPHHMAFSFSNALNGGGDMWPERRLLEGIKSIAKERKLELDFSIHIGFPSNIIVREELRGDEDYIDMCSYNEKKWSGKKWAQRIIRTN